MDKNDAENVRSATLFCDKTLQFLHIWTNTAVIFIHIGNRTEGIHVTIFMSVLGIVQEVPYATS